MSSKNPSSPSSSPHADLIIEGARQNNLKNISLRIPHNAVTVITGVSGSGKSSLAFDTLFAEGQWRYVESLSSYTRMFLDRVKRPDVDRLTNIRPSIALEQKNPIRTSRSTVGTTSEISDYLRLLFSKIGRLTCPDCKVEAIAHHPTTVASSEAGPSRHMNSSVEASICSATIRLVRFDTGRALDESDASSTGWKASRTGSSPLRRAIRM